MKFNFHNPTRVCFGPGEFSRAGELASKLGRKCLLVTGQGSAERLGFLAKMLTMLDEKDISHVHYSGVEPNPHLETCVDAAEIAIREKCDFIIALGGGSVMDAGKAIAAGFHDPYNLWDYVMHGQQEIKPVEEALPLMVIPTLAATGSEMDAGGVITKWETKEKCVIASPALFPDIALIDPELTLSVSLDYTMDGVFDMAVHVMESYFNGNQETPLQGRMIEGFLKVAFEEGSKLFQDPGNLKLRENVQWPSSLALSGFLTAGRGGAYPVHELEHPLSARWDISHGRGLALIQPRWMQYVMETSPSPLADFAINVMGVDASGDPLADAGNGIKALCEWLDSVGLFLTLSDLGIEEDSQLEEAAADAIRLSGTIDAQIGGVLPLEFDDVLSIYRMCGTRDFLK